MEQEQETATAQNAVVVLDDYSVILADKDALQAFFTGTDGLDSLYNQIEKMAKGLVADVSTKEGVSQIKSCARQIASVKKKVDDIGKDVVADLKKLPGIIDANRRLFRDRMEALQDEIRRPVTEIENREDEIDGIKGMHLKLAMATSEQIRHDLEYVKSIPLTDDKWKESLAKATKAINGEISALELLLTAAEKREKEAAELEELRKKNAENERIINEQRIREEARAEGFAQGMAAGADNRKESVKGDGKQIATQAESPTPAVSHVGPKPSAWTKAQKDINNAIVAEIARLISTKLEGFTESGYKLAAQEIVKAIIKGQINNLKVEY